MIQRTTAHTCLFALVTLVGLISTAAAQEYRFRVVASGLARPLGIAVEGSETIYFTIVPTPGVAGGANGVAKLDLETGAIETLHMGEPEPTNIALDRRGNIFWTCKSAGVILKQSEVGATSLVLGGQQQPSGISVDRLGNVYFTEVPNPGVPGAGNGVAVFDGASKTVLHMGEPEPTDIVVARNGRLYWTCRSAGVILEQANGETRVLLAGLDHPTGIALDHKGEKLFFTEVPTPGVPGRAGGRNRVLKLDLATSRVAVVHEGDPEPTDVAVARNGNVYWTCTSAGVIVEAKRIGGR
jgi:DNA-binding beta-propeller fold protein YncE